jgi:LysM repeat protein
MPHKEDITMRNSRNQLIIAIVFALLLGLIIVIAARCSSTSTTPARTPTPKTTPATNATPRTSVTPGPVGSGTVIPGRATDVSIVPPGTQPSPVPTQISVGPLPGTTPLPAATTVPGVQPGAPTAVVLRPTAVPVATVAIPAGGIIYTVKSGDSLSTIARTYGTTTAILAQANNITNVSRIYVGQKLRIPGVSAPAGTATTTGRVYVVQAGDSLSKIAVKYGVTVSAIMKANNISNANLIRVGQKLTIP